ncbi:component of IIS longevity pathway SMK-1 protein (macronuclear) [Tetrahymena thermophila SB210]|uniref:Component of IIS longevity pathway SMK-1 protein n=1 Tax=Tetrahymena thermophila (strain SB210) TaxID=312017 RepID=Q23K33_TETTS|nr:component of IIS longevity pathway SMK-1 protein [Tetrahymena thermophila SB210]EAR97010.2 component of IIS longevity pathway SMK-1 protein [Tetrahymena thermophila SB210]|eukprot:XP_001017255.2 component of IIS longevity pathway SMK-1 protein [Tetrahymena thermophila SB210]
MSYPAPYNPIEGIPEIFRAKLFKLDQQSNTWRDIGLGYPKIIQTSSSEGYLLKFYLEKNKSEVFSENLSNDLIIENPKEKQITISNDLTEDDIAISFQNEAGRLALWKQIKEVKSNISYQKQEDEFRSYKKQFEEAEEEGQFILPIPNINNLEAFLKILMDTPAEDRNVISSEMMVRQSVLFRNFREVFNKCEKENNLDALNTLCQIFKSLIFYSEHELLQVLLNEENYILTFGILEYDEQMYNKQKETHRQFFQKRAKFLSVVQFKDQSKLDDIHFNFRLQYLRDSALAHILDESTLNLMNLISQRIYKNLIQYIITSREMISQILNALNLKDYQSLCMVYDMFQSMKNMDNFLETSISIYDAFYERTIFEMLDSFLRNYEKPNQGNQMQSFGIQRKKQQILDENQLEMIPQMIVSILIQYMNNKPQLLLKYMRSMEEKVQKYKFFQLICESVMNQKYTNNQLYFSDLLKLILENSVKNDEDYVFIEQFLQIHLGKMLDIFYTADYSEEKIFGRILLIDIIVNILKNLDNICMCIPNLTYEVFFSIPQKMLPLFHKNLKHLHSQIISLYISYIEINKPEFHQVLYDVLVPLTTYLVKKIKNKNNLIYSEIIKLFKLAQTSQILISGLQQIHLQFEKNIVYQHFLNDIRKSIPPEENNSSQATNSLFNITNVKISLDSHKRFDNILGKDEIDIDFIRKSSQNSSPKSPVGSNSSSPIKQSQNFNNYEDDDHEVQDIVQKRFKSSSQ